jgi:hypothetical protein
VVSGMQFPQPEIEIHLCGVIAGSSVFWWYQDDVKDQLSINPRKM